MKNLRRFALPMLVLTLAVGCRQSPPAEPAPPTAPEATPRPIVQMPTPDPDAKPGDVTLYRVRMDQDGSTLEARKGTVPPGSTPDQAQNALEQMVGGDDSPFPKDTRVLGVTFAGDLATIDFNAAFQKNFEGGDLMEALAVNAVAATVGQFPGIKRVQILVEGKTIPTLGGGQTLDKPIPVPAP